MPETSMPRRLYFKARRRWLQLLGWLLHLWVRTTVLPEELDELQLDPERPVFYVLDNYALTSLLILDRICAINGWPRPDRVFEREDVWLPRSYGANRRSSGWLFSRQQARRHSKMLARLVDAGAIHAGSDLQIVPVTVLIGRAPDNEDSLFKILFSENWNVGGRFRRLLSTLVNGRATMVQFAPPLDLPRLLEQTDSDEQSLGRLSRVLRVHFKRVRTAAIGPDRSHRRTLVERLIRTDEVQQAIAAKSRRDKISLDKAERQARSYAREIAADYSYTAVRVLDLLLTWFWNRIYRGVQVFHFSRFRDASAGHEIVYVPCHRSHIDYLLLSYLLYHRGFVPPHIAAGINLNMPVVGSILRRGGAFFLRRSFRSQPLYAAVFNQYVSLILSRGVALEYFIEGTRSRTGRLLPPRAGMLSITVRAFLRYRNRPVMFQPVYIGYERLAEGNAYIHELSGHQKKPESLSDLRNVVNILRKNYGEVAVSFGKPVMLNDLLDKHHPAWSEETLDVDSKPKWLPGLVDDLADQILVNINGCAHVNPINLLASALLASRKHALDEDDLLQMIDLLRTIILQTRSNPLITVTEKSAQEIVDYGLELKIIERQPHQLGTIIRTDPTSAVLLTYFRNNIAHLLALPSWIASCFLNSQTVREARIHSLSTLVYPFLKRELFLGWSETDVPDAVASCIECLNEQGLLKRSGERLQRNPGGSDQTYYLRLLAHSLIQTFERYFITVSVLVKNGSGLMSRGQLEQLCILCAQRISILHEFEAPEFYDRTLFRQFIDSLTASGILGRDENGCLTFDNRLEQFARDARLILGKEVRHTIIQTAPEVLELESDSAA